MVHSIWSSAHSLQTTPAKPNDMEVLQVKLISNVTATAAATVSDKLSTAIIIPLLLLTTFLLHLSFVFYHGGSLRAQTYRSCSKTAVSGDNYSQFCTVCLHDIDDGERYRKLPECKHCFHVDCIDTWFESRSTCPLCRNQVFDHRNRDRHRRGFIGYLLSFLWIIFRKICRYFDVDVTCDD